MADLAVTHPVVFGTYRLNDLPVLDLAVRQAIDAGVTLIDTAVMYNNDEAVAKIVRDTPARVGTKFKFPRTIAADLSRAIELFGPNLERVLLHRPMPYTAYAVLEEARERGLVKTIGVCNYSYRQLEELLRETCERGFAPPDIVQNELHPALNTPVIALCSQHGIVFEAHSTMSAATHLAPIASRASSGVLTPATLALLHCKAVGAHALCITTTKYEHLQENLKASATPEPARVLQELLPKDALDELALLPSTHPSCRYGRQATGERDSDAPHPLRLAMALAMLEKDMRAFRAGGVPSDLCLSLPKVARAAPRSVNGSLELARELAAHIFGIGQPGAAKFDGLLTKMRAKVEESKAERKRSAKAMMTCKIGPVDAVEKAEELPVDVPDGDTFEALLRTLEEARGPVARLTTAGALTRDGRLDLCKQVVRPRFGDLVDSIVGAAPGVVAHFLVGNNIIFKRLATTSNALSSNDADTGTDDDARIMVDAHADEPLSPSSRVVADNLKAFEQLAASAQPIRTFYLAGNGITAKSSQPIAAALLHARSLESLWLKMNPISTGAYHFGALAAASPTLVLLDLFNAGLLDAGLAALAEGLSGGGLQLAPPLQHLYLNVNGLTAEAMPSLLQIVSSLPKLESLFIGENQLGDDAAALLERMPTRPLRRLELGSNGLTDAALPSLLAFATRHRDTLRSLELSSYKSTHYFRLKPNLLASTPAGADHLVAITSTGLAYLGLDNCLPSRAVAAALLARLSTGTAACSINARQRRTAHDDEGPSPLAEPRRATDTSAFLTAAAVTVVSFAALGAVQARSTAAALAGVTAGLAAAMAGILVASGALQAPTNGKSTTTLAAVTYGSSTFSLLKHETEELQAIRRPPQLQHIFSIYRNAM
ncbi:hypothetical protein EMIHUDRAFT_99472 [Emiliania huxleyi CCMP1516]|uniref:NADP-dependent oxidoreductase domain-containing protein n=2 Tax=Emiliania huxleyi TaxID=2903 RepID=A0A0D3K2M6_EMIH1|nr:hypothetical protein EMIHUDRAFT_99472 [Emiliania huxleyi CCMP1516]EOD30011.1 hypothetical protein EMIHUDRAFT_99472 [Emiliania huxleyi CCMP1516]|eukprot:XP_005782440.1 hypothetical protein EMIHUDRAFT_99472 [Emiliania huxleyi CCMP1516]